MSVNTAPSIPLGILGLGNMGRGHLRVLSMLRNADVKFVFDPDPAAAGRARQLGYSGPVLSQQHELAAACADVDALVIATPTSTHYDIIATQLGRIPHLFVEKPLTATLAEAQEIATQALDAGAHVQVGFIERYNPAIQTLRSILSGSTGVISVDFTRTNKLSERITDVDVVVDLMIHDLDLALFLNGPVASVHAQGVHTGGMVEFASAQLTHENGRHSRIQASRITERKKRLVEATCRDMFVECELLRKEVLISRQSEIHADDAGPYTISARQDAVEVPYQEALLSEMQAFLGACAGAQVEAPGIDEAVAALALCESIQSLIVGEVKR